MEEWKEYKLRDFLLIPIRNGLTKPSAIRGQGVKMIGMKEIFAMDYIRSVEMDRVPVTNKEYESSEIMKYDLLFARQSLTLEGAGKCSIVVSVDEPTVFESHLIRLRIDTKKANPFFIYYYYKSSIGKNQIKSLVQQVAAAGIRGKELIELGIKVPHIEKQNQIVNILRVLDDKIEVNKRINENLEQQAQALFKSWFVDFEPFKDQPFVESELGMIPQGWKVQEAQEVFTINIGKTPPRKESEWFSESNYDNVWVSIADMGACGTFISDSSEYLTDEAVRRFNIQMIEKDSVLLSFKLTVGRVAIADTRLTTNEAIARFILPEKFYREFLYLYLKQYKYGNLGSTSSIATAVNSKTIKGMKLLIPKIEEIRCFSVITRPLFEQIRVIQNESRCLAELRDTLLPRLMSGELKVNDLD